MYATDSYAPPVGPDNPHGLALVQRATALRTESDGRQDYDWYVQRTWKVSNDNVRGGLGTPVAYKLVPGAAMPALLDSDSPVLRRARARAHAVGHRTRLRSGSLGLQMAVVRVRQGVVARGILGLERPER